MGIVVAGAAGSNISGSARGVGVGGFFLVVLSLDPVEVGVGPGTVTSVGSPGSAAKIYYWFRQLKIVRKFIKIGSGALPGLKLDL